MRASKASAVVLVLLVLLGLAPRAAQAQATPPQAGPPQGSPLVRLSFSSGWDALPAMVAIERGFMAQEGLVVSGLAVASATALIESLVVGSTDFAVVSQRVLLVIAAAKVPVKAV